MPKLLTNRQNTPKEQMIGILTNTTGKKWRIDLKRCPELIKVL
jgi:hypothetical protein